MKANKELKGVAEEDALRKLLNSESEDEDENEEKKKAEVRRIPFINLFMYLSTNFLAETSFE